METMPIITALGIPGIISLADANAVDEVVRNINENHPDLGVTKDNLLRKISQIPTSEQKDVYDALVNSIDESGNTMLSILCAVISLQAGVEVNRENLSEIMTSSPNFIVSYLFSSGIPGFIDYASEEDMEEVYLIMNDYIMNLEVNDKIFSLLLMAMPDDQFAQLEETLYNMAPAIDETYESVLKTLDDAEKALPDSINFFAKDFKSKDVVEQFIKDYNDKAKTEGRDKDVIQYSDIVGALMSSVTTIVNAISYVLIAFVSISLVVSSIMIGIITNISVLERTKEIGVLRAIGASKKDISRVFNAETLIIGLAAGAIGILSTLILCIPITAIVQALTGLDNIRAVLPWQGAITLVIISMVLTLIAGIIPSRSAAKKDPVVALRTE
jgi:putative ABC transport system permease protein